MSYRIVFLDVDGTLLDFKASEKSSLQQAFKQFRLTLTSQQIEQYSNINQSFWNRFEKGEITKAQVLSGRFERFFQELKIDYPGEKFAAAYQHALANTYFYLDHSDELMKQWSAYHALYIVTNGVSSTQYNKLALCGFDQLVKNIFVSEDTGYQKPRKEYFEYCFERIPDFVQEDTIIIGDSLTSDMRGGNHAGIKTCWYNPKGMQNNEGVHIDYEIQSLSQVAGIID